MSIRTNGGWLRLDGTARQPSGCASSSDTAPLLRLAERLCVALHSVAEPALDAASLLATLERRGVRFIVIGGLAAVLHGAPYQTVDCDITPEDSADNLGRLSAALDELHARIWTGQDGGFDFRHDARSLKDARIWNLITEYGLLDISFEPAGTRGYADLIKRAVVVEVDATSFAVASLEDVIRSKQAAGRDKDIRVLPLLRRMLAEGVQLRYEKK